MHQALKRGGWITLPVGYFAFFAAGEHTVADGGLGASAISGAVFAGGMVVFHVVASYLRRRRNGRPA
jgi:hypothetical protein